MSSATFRLILLISSAHALVHLYELALPSVEQEIAQEFVPDDLPAGKRFSGTLSNYWRLCFGLGALVAGWLVDRLGAGRMLTVYLLGCGGLCLATGFSASQSSLVAIMLAMGLLASIYHPAGLSLISQETDPQLRPRALGLHGIFGSMGIAAGPFLAWLAIGSQWSWRQYYWSLAFPGLLLGLVLGWWTLRRGRRSSTTTAPSSVQHDESRADWPSFGLLLVFAVVQGFIYSAQVSFLPRYLSYEGAWTTQGKLYAAFALLLGCIGQYLAGRFAKADRLEFQLSAIMFANIPCLVWMAFASPSTRLWAAGVFATVHFMHQPIYNSLIPKYAPSKHRSLCFGVSFAMGLGVGSFGAQYAGRIVNNLALYSGLTALALAAGLIGLALCWLNHFTSRRH